MAATAELTRRKIAFKCFTISQASSLSVLMFKMNFPEIVDLARGARQTYEIASGSKLGIDATKKIPGKVLNAPGRR